MAAKHILKNFSPITFLCFSLLCSHSSNLFSGEKKENGRIFVQSAGKKFLSDVTFIPWSRSQFTDLFFPPPNEWKNRDRWKTGRFYRDKTGSTEIFRNFFCKWTSSKIDFFRAIELGQDQGGMKHKPRHFFFRYHFFFPFGLQIIPINWPPKNHTRPAACACVRQSAKRRSCRKANVTETFSSPSAKKKTTKWPSAS